MIIVSKYCFKSITSFNNYTSSIFIYIVSAFIPIYMLMAIKIFLKGRFRKDINNNDMDKEILQNYI